MYLNKSVFIGTLFSAVVSIIEIKIHAISLMLLLSTEILVSKQP